MKNKVVFIVGPTAVGKTSFALRLASKFNGEIVSADSVQVFRGLDIISGKDLPNGYTLNAGYYHCHGCPSIHLLDVLNPTSSFDVAKFYEKATFAIKLILEKGKLPIVVGGTGLYIEALLNGLVQTSKPDYSLREKLNSLEILELQKLLPKKILDSLNASDKKNKRRLIRKIETQSENLNPSVKEKPGYESMVIGLSCERLVLRTRIDERVKERLRNGALEEAKNLFKDYTNLTQQVKNANGYKQLFMFLKGKINLDEAVYRWKISEYRHAKNQMTWFRKYGGVIWCDIGSGNFEKITKEKVEAFLL